MIFSLQKQKLPLYNLSSPYFISNSCVKIQGPNSISRCCVTGTGNFMTLLSQEWDPLCQYFYIESCLCIPTNKYSGLSIKLQRKNPFYLLKHFSTFFSFIGCEFIRHIHTRLNWVWICMTYIHTRLNTIINTLFNIEWINIFPYHAAVWYLPNLSLLPNWDYQNVTAHNWTCHLLIYSHYNWEQKYNWLCRGMISTRDIRAQELWNSGGKLTAHRHKANKKYPLNFLIYKRDTFWV